MNSYFSLTVAPSRSTLPLFLGRHSPFPVHGSSVPAHATEHVRKCSARAHPGVCFTIGAYPVAHRCFTHSELTRDIGDRTRILDHQFRRLLTKLRSVLLI